jgi:hypothetical protein
VGDLFFSNSDFTFYLRPCGQVTTASCNNANNANICQVSPIEYDVLSYYTPASSSVQWVYNREGSISELTADGTYCAATGTNRISNITYVCEPAATTPTILSENEAPICSYSFVVVTTAVCGLPSISTIPCTVGLPCVDTPNYQIQQEVAYCCPWGYNFTYSNNLTSSSTLLCQCALSPPISPPYVSGSTACNSCPSCGQSIPLAFDEYFVFTGYCDTSVYVFQMAMIHVQSTDGSLFRVFTRDVANLSTSLSSLAYIPGTSLSSTSCFNASQHVVGDANEMSVIVLCDTLSGCTVSYNIEGYGCAPPGQWAQSSSIPMDDLILYGWVEPVTNIPCTATCGTGIIPSNLFCADFYGNSVPSYLCPPYPLQTASCVSSLGCLSSSSSGPPRSSECGADCDFYNCGSGYYCSCTYDGYGNG